MDILVYNPKSVVDLVRVLRIVVRQILLLDNYACSSNSYMTRVVSNKRLIRYEKGSKVYKFYYDNYCNVMDSRTARKLLSVREMIGFLQLNENDVINAYYINCVDEKGVHLAGNDKVIPLSRKGRQVLENYIKF